MTKSRLNSRVFPSWRFNSSTSLTTPHSTRKLLLTGKASERVDSANGRLTITGYAAALAISRKWWAFLYATREMAPIKNCPPTGVLLGC